MKKRLKKWVTAGMSLVMAAALCLTSVPVSVSAASTVAADDSSFVIEDGVLKKYTGIKAVVTIPEGVKKIEKQAFQYNKEIEKVIFPTTLCDIDQWAFRGCKNLTTVKMSYRVKGIGNGAFKDCTSLQTVDLSMTGLEVLQGNAFAGCTSLTQVTLPESIKVIGGDAFNSCRYLGSINLPEGLTTIQLNAFNDCDSLTAVALPDTLQFLGNGAFARCHGLESIRIPAGITTLQESVFSGDYNLDTVYLPDTMRTIQSAALATKDGDHEKPGSLSSLYIPESVEYIYRAGGASSFGMNRASGIKEIQAKSGSYGEKYAKYISGSASGLEVTTDLNGNKDVQVDFTPVEDDAVIHFDACGGKLAAGEEKKAGIIGQMYGKLPTPELKNYQFLGWYQDKGLKNPAKTTTLITQAETTVYAKWEKETAEDDVYQGPSSDFTIKDGVLEKYTGNESVVVVPDGVTELKGSVFAGKEFIRKIVLPESVTVIGNSAFQGCSNLTELNIPSGVTVIPDEMCSGCYSLQSIVIPEGVTEIGKNAFAGDATNHYYSALAHVELPDSLVRIGAGAFSQCRNLLDLRLPDGLQEIGAKAFFGTAIRRISIPAGVKTLSDSIFSENTGLEELRLPNGLETIGSDIIRRNECLERLYIPETVTTIAADALDVNLPSKAMIIAGVKPGNAYDYYERLKVNSSYSNLDITFEEVTDKQRVHISFDTGVDGLQLEEREAYVGLAFGSLPQPVQAGKVFAGWSLTTDDSGLIADTDVIRKEDTKTENSVRKVTLTAVWKDAVKEKPEGTPVVPEPEGDTEDKKVVEINTLEELSAIRENLHGNYKLMADIDASAASEGYGFCPIGAVKDSENEKYTEKAFDGVFDGNGHTISGLTIQGDAPYVSVGLFARVEGGVIKNLNLKDVKIKAGTASRRVGAVAGRVNAAENTGVRGCIENVTVSGEVGMTAGKDVKTQIAVIGGAVGYVGNAKVSNVKNQAVVSYWSEKQEKLQGACNRHIGGVAGFLSGGELYQCSNTGDITVYRDYYGEFSGISPDSIWDIAGMIGQALSGESVNLNAGGILGYAASWETKGRIVRCYNTGDVQAVMNHEKNLSTNFTSHSDVYAGGITGYIYSNTGVENCYNKGTVIGRSMEDTSLLGADAESADTLRQYLDANTVSGFKNADAYAAGIAGSAGACASGPIRYCYNTGKVSGSEGKVYGIVNGDIQTNRDIPIAYSRYAAAKIIKDGKEVDLTGSSRPETSSGCQALEADQLALQESYRGFDFGGEWLLIENSGMESPMLLGNMEKKIVSAKFVTDESNPVKTKYAYGEALDLTGLKMELKLEGFENPLMIDISAGTVSGYDPYREGEQKLSISCAGQSMELTVFVNAPLYELNVTNGSGDGYYSEGTKVTIQAEDIAKDKRFVKWVVVGGDIKVDQPDKAKTVVTMGTKDSSIVAEYEQLYEVKVTNGSGSGFYGVGDTVTVTADEPKEGYYFSGWTGKLVNNGSATLEHPEDATMTFVVPEDPHLYPLKLTANYQRGSKPSAKPTGEPSVEPSGEPSAKPDTKPSGESSTVPSATPAGEQPKNTNVPKQSTAPVQSPAVSPGQGTKGGVKSPKASNAGSSADKKKTTNGKKLSVKGLVAKKNSKKITGTTVAKAKVQVKVNGKTYQVKAGKKGKFVVRLKKKLKKKTKVSLKITLKNYKSYCKTFRVK